MIQCRPVQSLPYRYRLFGLEMASELELESLSPPGGDAAAVDVVIRRGEVPPELERPAFERLLFQVEARRWLFRTEDVVGARFLVRDGREIVVEQRGGAAAELQPMLLGSVSTALLFQRGCIPLHGSAVAVGDGAVVFAGLSGVGKSTLAAALVAGGHALLADDIACLHAEPGAPPLLAPQGTSMRLWPESLDRLGMSAEGLARVQPDLEKRYRPVAAPDPALRPLRHVYVLSAGVVPGASIERLSGAAKLRELQAHLHRGRFEEATAVWPALFERLAQVARAVPVSLVVRPSDRFDLAGLVEAVRSSWS